MRTPRQRLEATARDHDVDPSGLTDRELAICVLVKLRVDLDQPNSRGAVTKIRDAEDASLIMRAIIFGETTPSAREVNLWTL